METKDQKKIALYDQLAKACIDLEKTFDSIPEERREQLKALGNYIQQKMASNETPKLIVICTHNSRRSHIGQLWLAVAADYYQLPAIETYSGGTEATAFNIRSVHALQRIGFEINTHNADDQNPEYHVTWNTDMKPYLAFSKKYDDAPNPKEAFGAVMVCSEADEGCPFVFGCDFRLSLPYDDPKAFDDTDLEALKYDERVQQIGREILYAMYQVQH